MATNVIALLCSAAIVDAFASRPTDPQPVWPPPYQPDTKSLWDWAKSASACSTPKFWSTNWESYPNSREKCPQSQADDWTEQTHFTLMNYNELAPQRFLSRGSIDDYLPLEKDHATYKDLIDNYDFYPITGDGSGFRGPVKASEQFMANKLDGVLIMLNGKNILEEYFNGHTADTRHMGFSMTKSWVGLMAKMLIEDKLLDEDALIADIVPALKGSGYDGATVRDALSMRVALAFDEQPPDCNETAMWAEISEAVASAIDAFESTGTYSIKYPIVKHCELMQLTIPSPHFSGIWAKYHALAWNERVGVPYQPGPQTVREFIQLLKNDSSRVHGHQRAIEYDGFSYQSAVTEALAWVIDATLSNTSGSAGIERASDYFVQKLWSKLGQGTDAMIALDGAQSPLWLAGSSATLPDMARMGQMLLQGGKNKRGEQVVHPAIVDDLHHPPAEYLPNAGCYSSGADMGYYNQFWVGRYSTSDLGDDFVPKEESWFRMAGRFNQLVFVFPYLNLTVAQHANNEDYNEWVDTCEEIMFYEQLAMYILCHEKCYHWCGKKVTESWVTFSEEWFPAPKC